MEPNINPTPIQKNQIVTPPVLPAKSSSKLLPILLAVFLISIIATGAYVFGKYSAGLKNTPTQPNIALPTTIPTPLPTTDPTVGWETYSDKNITFQYPNDWEKGEMQLYGSRSEIDFIYNKTVTFTVSYLGNYNNGTGKKYSSLEEFLGQRKSKANDISINGITGKIIDDPGDAEHVIPFEEVIFFSPDKLVIISIYYMDSYYPVVDNNKIIDQILSTFKFIE